MTHQVDTSRLTLADEVKLRIEPGVTRFLFKAGVLCRGAQWKREVERLASPRRKRLDLNGGGLPVRGADSLSAPAKANRSPESRSTR